ncbi:hypothetical protein [Pseudopedobacter beijingensis]|uniref:Right handed beta helix region n=1 Tax=Pseudopedobacter beijingensis TaxID=1207056 RepID=A0ABW4I8D5_9SPHI
MKVFGLLTICSFLFLIACNKEQSFDNSPSARLNFSTDTLFFDTVFTEQGSTMRTLKIFNYNKQKIRINELKLAGLGSSSFKMNVNGVSTDKLANIEIDGNDSIYVFVKVFIDPNAQNSTFLVEDSILINFNQKTQKIPLVAYGQNAVYIKSEQITSNTTFTKDKPYLIFGNLVVDKDATLTIDGGAKVYFHKKSKLTVNGTLQANGTLTDSIVFASDRTERIYRDEPGQWEGIYLNPSSKDSHFNYCIIKNAITGVYVDSLSNNSNPKLLLTNTIIKNHQIAGILAYRTHITGINNLLFNCGKYLLGVFNGGNYQFYQSTFAGYNPNMSRTDASVYFSDKNSSNTSSYLLDIDFRNNIIWGNNRNELEIIKETTQPHTINFERNVLKTTESTISQDNIFNIDPIFRNPRFSDFRVNEFSVANDYGKSIFIGLPSIFIDTDLQGYSRVFPSTVGCYEKKAEP